ncbi:hypothetical protein FW778_19290 [Ginsengibacter hankyongi]|uniref:Uncharacterized protein n=1 Tax=Ginsengibacter hankyongi TaxID=2607284 RepID=A0A5J5IDR3_9BACT|nr:hypothetical protein [Ginsengibacter hankyongi]KAA9036375.1 hypothetical protein FW778_19290 [Ginsengibacter hankyongi]
MGIQTNIKLRGTVENIIYYQWKGIHCIRTVPAKVRQTKPTKKAAKDFGLAVKSSAVVRYLLRPLMPKDGDRSVIYKVDGAFRKWLKENPLDNTEPADGIPDFEGLAFNDDCDLQKIVQFQITFSRGASGEVLLQWPACNPVSAIKAPTGTCQLVVQCIAATVDVKAPGRQQSTAINFTIPYRDEMMPGREIVFANATSPQCLALVGMSIRYYKDELQSKPINIMRWKPAGIAASFFN